MARVLSAVIYALLLTSCAPLNQRISESGIPYASKKGLASYMQGLYAQESGQPERAFREFGIAYELDPSPRILDQLFGVAVQLDRLEDLLPIFDEVLEHNPNHLDLLFLQGELRTRYGPLSEAIRRYMEAQHRDPNDSRISFALGQIYRIKGNNEEAEKEFQKTLVLNPNSVEAMIQLAVVWDENEHTDKAVELLKKAMKIDPTHLGGVRTLGRMLEKEKEYSEVEIIFKSFIDKSPSEPAVRKDLANFYFRRNQWAAAELQYREMVRSGFRSMGILEGLGLSLLHQNQAERALVVFDAALKQYPSESILLLHKIQALIELKRYNEAATGLELFLSKEEGASPNLWRQLGMLQYQQGKATAAVSSFRQAYEQDPEDPEAAYFWGTASALNDNNEEALRAFRVVLRLKPDHEGAAFQMGVVLEKMGDTKGAVTAFRDVIRLNPENGDAYNYIGYTYAESGNNLDEAEALVRRALALAPKNSAYMDSLGWIQFQRAHYAEAVKSLEQAILWAEESGSEDAVLYDHLGSAQYLSGNPEEARIQWQRALDLSPEDESLRRKVEDGIP